jgi:hypothetical protein
VKLADRALLRTRLARAAGAAAWTLAPLAILALYRHPLPGAETAARAVGHVTLLDALRDKAATALTPLASYNLAQEAVLGLTLAALVAWLWRRRILAGHAGLVLAAAGLFVLAIVLPERLMGASWIDRRFPVMALFALLAALQTRIGLPRRAALELGATGLALAVLQAAWIGWTWQAMTRDMDAVREVLAHAPAGARIVPVQHHPALQVRWRAPAGRYMFAVGDPTFRHYDALAVPERRAFVPNLFSARGLQPLRVLGDWDGVVEHNGGDLASIDALVRAPRPDEARYLDRWRERFDYVLVLNADLPDQAGPFRPPPGLTRVAVTRFAELWRIGPPGGRHGPSVRRSA